jgi:uncharacterized Zn finger protein
VSQWARGQREDLQRRPEHPRRVVGGYRLRRKTGMDGLPWLAHAWLDPILASADPTAKIEGLQYAQSGQCASIVVGAGMVDASVQGRAPRPYETRLAVDAWTHEQWDAAIAALSAEAVHSARFLTGDVPPAVEQVLAKVGLVLVPSRPGAAASGKRASTSDPAWSCTCGDPLPCKHVVCVAMLVAERLESEPMQTFQMRGLMPDRLLERIQEQRALSTRGESQAHPLPPCATGADLAAPLERSLADFWRPGRTLADLESQGIPPHTPHALLRRLGPSTLGGKFPLVGLLASIYDTMRARGISIRDRDSGGAGGAGK